MRDLLNLLDNTLVEASLQPSKLRPGYLQNLIDLISNGTPVPLVGSAHAKYGEAAIFKKSVARELKQLLAHNIKILKTKVVTWILEIFLNL